MSRNRSDKERFRYCLRIVFTFVFSHLGLCALVVAYVTIGALIFPLLEAQHELEQRKVMQHSRSSFLLDVWNVTGSAFCVISLFLECCSWNVKS